MLRKKEMRIIRETVLYKVVWKVEMWVKKKGSCSALSTRLLYFLGMRCFYIPKQHYGVTSFLGQLFLLSIASQVDKNPLHIR